MERVYNFSAGPSVLPLEVLEIAQNEFTTYGDSKMSVMEMSHRSKDFGAIISSAENTLREIMNIPNNYKILFLQGGASTQFAMIPLNFTKNKKADYVNTGQWSKKAISEAKKYTNVNVVASSEDKTFSYIPKLDKNTFTSDADYFHITLNNTIYGTKYSTIPEVSVPLIADISSCVLSEELDVSKFAMLYAGAQKNIGPAGLTVVIIREDMISDALDITPTMLQYKIHAENDSLYNTPPTFGIYMAKVMFDWVKAKGGVKAMSEINHKKADYFYAYLDESKLFNATVFGEDRSIMNIPFVTGNEEVDAKFVKESTMAGFVNLKGHRSVGGMRASIYNAMSFEGVKALVDFMKKFESENK